MRVQSVEFCPDARLHWVVGEEDALCRISRHVHRRVEVHEHDDQVKLPDSTPVRAVSFVRRHPYERGVPPDLGLYLDACWQPPWPHHLLVWPDFGVPDEAEPVAAALRILLQRARSGQRVEVGCLGGHGRTGVALACLAVLTGTPASEAVNWVRTAYCARAVETDSQAAFVCAFPGLRETTA